MTCSLRQHLGTDNMGERNEMLQVHVKWGSMCNECSRDASTILFFKVDAELRKALLMISIACAQPSIDVYGRCSKEIASHIHESMSNLNSDSVKCKVIIPDEDQRACILAASKAPSGRGRAWHEHYNSESGSVQVEFADFVNKIVR